jgi:ribonuclease-3
LRAALLHRSYASDVGRGDESNERLEFLGDSVLGFLVAERLYRLHPEASEGRLTRYRANLVNRKALAAIARGFDVGEALLMGKGTRETGAAGQDSVLADAWEALIGAVYLDGGLSECARLVERSLLPLREADRKDAKTRLQEETQARSKLTPAYVTLSAPPEHPQFTVEVRLSGARLASGKGPSKASAEQAAAELALLALGVPPEGGA